MLGQDTMAGERLMGPFVLIASFLIITSMVLAGMGSFFETAAGNWDELRGTQIIGSTEYTLRNPEAGWNITGANVTDRWDHEADENVAFYEDTPGEDDEIVVAIIRDNAWYEENWGDYSNIDEIRYTDYIMIYTEFGIWSNDEWAISYETIEANQVLNSNISVTEFGIRHNTTFALIITVDAPPELFSAGLWANAYNIKLGVPDFEEDVSTSSMWQLLAQIMTASLPECNDEVNTIIGATFWAGTCLLGFTIISRVIPFITGG